MITRNFSPPPLLTFLSFVVGFARMDLSKDLAAGFSGWRVVIVLLLVEGSFAGKDSRDSRGDFSLVLKKSH